MNRTAWLVVALLWPVALLNYLDRQMLASMKFSVMADVPTILTEANWGRMLGQFKWVYAILSPVGGYLADRFSRRLVRELRNLLGDGHAGDEVAGAGLEALRRVEVERDRRLLGRRRHRQGEAGRREAGPERS